MFNRTIIHAPAQRPVVHHEHRAPTDESVRLLSEMERAAQDKVERTIRLEHNSFKGVIRFFKEAHDETLSAECLFDMNGQRIKVVESINAHDQMVAHLEGRDALFEKLRDAVAKRVAEELIIPSFKAHRT